VRRTAIKCRSSSSISPGLATVRTISSREDLPIPFAQAMERLLQRVFCHAQLARDFRLGRTVRLIGEQFLKALEKRCSVISPKLVTESRENLLEHR
jgi:hypothetical protein